MIFNTTISEKDHWRFISPVYFNDIFVNGLSGTDGDIILNGESIVGFVSNNTTFISDVQALSGNWEDTYTLVSNNSAFWSTHTDVSALSAQVWINTSNIIDLSGDMSFIAGASGYLIDTYTTVSANSAYWGTHTDVSGLSAQVDINTGDITFISGASGNWDDTYTTVSVNSADWGTHTDVSGLSAQSEVNTINIISLSSNQSEFVTYDGATSSVDLGANNLNVSSVYASGVITGSNIKGINTGDQDLGNYITYTGATTDVDLGSVAFTVSGETMFGNKIKFTQTDGNEYIDSKSNGYMDYGATIAHRFDKPIVTGASTPGVSQFRSATDVVGNATPNVFIDNANAEGRASIILSSGSYPSNYLVSMTHGLSVTSNSFASTDGYNDAGKAILLGQGSSLREFVIGTYSDRPLGLFSNNTMGMVICCCRVKVIHPTHFLDDVVVDGIISAPVITLSGSDLQTTLDSLSGQIVTNTTNISALSANGSGGSGSIEFTIENPMGLLPGDKKHVFVPSGVDIEQVRLMSYWGTTNVSVCWHDIVFTATGDDVFTTIIPITAFPQTVTLLTSGCNGAYMQFRETAI